MDILTNINWNSLLLFHQFQLHEAQVRNYSEYQLLFDYELLHKTNLMDAHWEKDLFPKNLRLSNRYYVPLH